MKFEECLDAFKAIAREEAESLGCESETNEVAPVSKKAYSMVWHCEFPKVDIKLFVKENERIEMTYWASADNEAMAQLCVIHCARITPDTDSFELQGGSFGQGEAGKNVLVDLYVRIAEVLEN